jgi:hypothetical protein
MKREQRRHSNHAETQIAQLLQKIKESYESYIVLKYVDLMALDPEDKGSWFPDDYHKLTCNKCFKKINDNCTGKELQGYEVMQCVLRGGVREVVRVLGEVGEIA